MLEIGNIYLKHFVKNIDNRWVILQGGRRSGKSWSIHRWLRFLCSGKNRKTVLVVTATYPQLQLCVADWENSTGIQTWMSQKHGRTCVLPNGSRWLFKSFDNFSKAQGSSCDYLFLNEALQIPEEVISTLSMSVTTQIYVDYNPSRTSYLDKYILPDKSNFLKTTYKDNPFLTEAQIQEFKDIEARASRPGASTIEVFQKRVYCDGDFSSLGGKVFKTIYTISREEYDKIPVPELYGLDFGLVDSGDHTALVACKIYQGKLYGRQIIYSQELASNKALAQAMIASGLDQYSPIVADYGGLGKSRIHALVTADDGAWVEPPINQGFNLQNARKTKVIDGLSEMLQYQIFLTDDSEDLHREMDAYELSPTGSPKGKDHAIDALRYATHSWRFNYEY